jgi:HEAT repeat protein
MLYEVLGWNLTMLDRLESLAASLDGEAIQKLTKLIARLDGHRNEWKADKVRLLDGLRARAENRESFDRVSTKAFEDILELRATGTADAVPVLADILSDNAGTGRIHGHAAEQALFCIGTPSAFKVLDQRLLEDNYGILRSAGYAHGWKMAEPLRSRFIERYLLRNLSKDLSIEVQAASSAEEEGRIDFVVTLRNVSQEIFQIVDRQIYHGDLLFLRSADSQFVRSMQYVDYDAPKGR